MDMHQLPFEIENRRGDTVWGDVRFVGAAGPKPVVVMCHGFKGFKDWGTFPAWGRHLAEAGFVSVLFNFSFNGVAPDDPVAFTRLDRFAENTFTRELDDLDAVLAAITEGTLAEAPIDPARLGLMGHSRGGGTAILQAASDPRVRALTTWSSVATFIGRFRPNQIEDWEAKGYTEVLNARTKQVMRLGRVLYDDALAHADRLDIEAAAARLSIPWLIAHAHDDPAVPFAEAQTLHNAAPHAHLYEAEGGHTFGGRHPFDGQLPGSLRAVFDRTAAFFKDVL